MADDSSGGELSDSSASMGAAQARRQAELAEDTLLPVGSDDSDLRSFSAGSSGEESDSEFEVLGLHDLSRTMHLSKVAASGLLQLLKVTTLRKNQFKLIRALVDERKDVWAQLPCGAGKTLIFIAALLLFCTYGRGGISIFIVPTVAIAEDMKATLLRLGIRVIELNGDTKAEVIALLKASQPPVGPVVILSKPKKMVNRDIIAALSAPPRPPCRRALSMVCLSCRTRPTSAFLLSTKCTVWTRGAWTSCAPSPSSGESRRL